MTARGSNGLKLALMLGTVTLAAQAQFPATSLCNTGLTPKDLSPEGCFASTPVYPINPADGGPIVDGNWNLAVPYPSAGATAAAPNPCSLLFRYSPAPVNAPDPAWSLDDQVSQWISPIGGPATPPGWYIYMTKFRVPPAFGDYQHYSLEVHGRYMVDNRVGSVYGANIEPGSLTCGPLATFSSEGSFTSWTQFRVRESVSPSSDGYLFFVVLNESGVPNQDPTGLRVEFETAHFTPY